MAPLPFVSPTRREEPPILSSALPAQKEEPPIPSQLVPPPRVEEEKPREKQESPPPPPPPRVPPSSPRVPLSSQGVREERPAVVPSVLLTEGALNDMVGSIKSAQTYNSSLSDKRSRLIDEAFLSGPSVEAHYVLMMRYLRSFKITFDRVLAPSQSNYFFQIKNRLQTMNPQEKQIMRKLLEAEPKTRGGSPYAWVTQALSLLGY